MATQPGTRGFWRGFLTGLVLAAAGTLALAWVFPPQPLLPPEVDEGSLLAPGAPGLPSGTAEPEAPPADALLPAAPTTPLIAGVPAPDAAPDASGGTAASPSLMPRTAP